MCMSSIKMHIRIGNFEVGISVAVLGVTRYLCNALRNIITFSS